MEQSKDTFYFNNTDNYLKSQKVRAIRQNILSMKQGGVGRDGETKNRLDEIEFRLCDISMFISNDIIDPARDFILTLKIV